MTAAIIVAAGRGVRMGSGVDKLLLELAGRPIIAHTWSRFDHAACIDEIVLVVRSGLEAQFEAMAGRYAFAKPHRFVLGGAPRQDSVWNGLQTLDRAVDLVAIHDGARPCTPVSVLERTLAAARRTGAAVAAQRVTDTVKESEDGRSVSRTLDRACLWTVQTPQAFGVHVPEIVAQDLGQGFLLLTDLGRRTYLQSFDGTNEPGLVRDATAALVRWQLATREGELPPYDEALLRREMNLFPEWYVGRHLGVALDEAQQQDLEGVFRRILASNLAEPRVFVHRDYMPRNLMVSDPNPGVLDFQDAVVGPASYDLASLLRDAFISWDEEREIDWAVRWWRC